MKFTALSIVLLALIVRSCVAAILVNTPEPEGRKLLYEAVANIVTSCYGGHIDAVGLVGNVPDSLIRALAEHSIPVSLTDAYAKSLNPTRRIEPQFRHELRVFIVGPSSLEHLYDILKASMNYAMWWDYMASYFILDSSPKCDHPEYNLYIAWRLNLINAKVVCLEPREGESVIFGFNPFKRQAPAPWRDSRVLRLPNGEPPFYFFRQNFRQHEPICRNLDFDKTTDLGGSDFHIFENSINPDDFRGNFTGSFSYNFFTTNKRIMLVILDVLHAKPKLIHHAINNGASDGGIKFTPTGINFETSTEAITYPHTFSGFVIVTKFRGNKSQLNKILTVVDINTRYGIGVVYLITLIFLKIFVDQALVPALLNLVRITCNTGFANLPNNTSPRIFLTGLLFFVVTIQGIYQGNLASLLTTKIPVQNVNTMQHLVDLRYEKIYSLKNVKIIIDQPYINERFVPVRDAFECIDLVKHDSSAACIVMTDGAIDLAIRKKLHVGNKIIVPTYLSFPTRLFWPVKNRVNKIISGMVEGNMLERWDVKCDPVKFTDFEIDEDVKANVNFKNIELSELAFSFVILGIGLACASVTFIVELVVHRYQSRVASVKVQILK